MAGRQSTPDSPGLHAAATETVKLPAQVDPFREEVLQVLAGRPPAAPRRANGLANRACFTYAPPRSSSGRSPTRHSSPLPPDSWQHLREKRRSYEGKIYAERARAAATRTRNLRRLPRFARHLSVVRPHHGIARRELSGSTAAPVDCEIARGSAMECVAILNLGSRRRRCSRTGACAVHSRCDDAVEA